ncbi:hypothetical protein, partial [Paludisphaera rhizosphaerae]
DIPRVAWLASEDNPDPVTRAQYRELADLPFDTTIPTPGEEATQEVPEELAREAELLDQARQCRYFGPDSCSCRYGRCSRLGQSVTPKICTACV